jgi:FlaA1/EpsC-like NDP-sugar epimerase
MACSPKFFSLRHAHQRWELKNTSNLTTHIYILCFHFSYIVGVYFLWLSFLAIVNINYFLVALLTVTVDCLFFAVSINDSICSQSKTLLCLMLCMCYALPIMRARCGTELMNRRGKTQTEESSFCPVVAERAPGWKITRKSIQFFLKKTPIQWRTFGAS